jgi:hypothetical protein
VNFDGRVYWNNIARGSPLLLLSVLYQLERRKKETKIYVVVFPLNKKPYRKPVCGLIPENQRINHSPPYLLVVTQRRRNKHRGTSEEVERKKENDPA